MKLSLCLLLLISLPAEAQQAKTMRSDSLNMSLQARYLLVSFGAGVEFPFRQHSFCLQLGYNFVPVDGNIYLDFNEEKIAAIEYKRYLSGNLRTGKQFYLGTYLLYKDINHAGPHEADYVGDWHESASLSLGPLLGYKWYKGQVVYFELFGGVHGGWQWGELRWDNRDQDSGELDPSYQEESKLSYGIRLGLSIGFHPFRQKVDSR